MNMKSIKLFASVLLMAVSATLTATLAYASDPTGVFARVDRVAMEPNTNSPETIQIWGVFSIADPSKANSYLPAARGYLYYKLADNPAAARKEWADLKQVAGTDQIVAFGSRWGKKAQLRKKDDKPENPDPYQVGTGVHKVGGNTDYAPIRAIKDYKD
jgi:hypothetical protein